MNSNQQNIKHQKFIRINTNPTEKRTKMFLQELDWLKKDLNKYVKDSINILSSCQVSIDIKNISRVTNSIQNQK